MGAAKIPEDIEKQALDRLRLFAPTDPTLARLLSAPRDERAFAAGKRLREEKEPTASLLVLRKPHHPRPLLRNWTSKDEILWLVEAIKCEIHTASMKQLLPHARQGWEDQLRVALKNPRKKMRIRKMELDRLLKGIIRATM